MERKIITINEELCNGCGACAAACHEGAIQMVNGKAKLIREDYCDGLGDCLPACPVNAISFEVRQAPAYDARAVEEAKRARACSGGGCPGSRSTVIDSVTKGDNPELPSCLGQWPVQIQLVSPMAGFLEGADILIAADCTAYAYGNFHHDFMQGRVTLIGCPKLDPCDYSQKLAQILALHEIRSLTVTRMQVPCCGGMVQAVKKAILASGKDIPLEVVTISADGAIIRREKGL